MQSLFAEPIELHSDTGTTFVDIDGEAYDELQWQCFGGDRLWQITIACDSDILLPILRRDSGAADTRVSGKYFYHTDHLGSANWVTNGDEAVQFIHYMPYGEMWYNQRGSAYNERYKYTGKERDEETGNDYFGARYYAAYTPMWLSPDPLMDKYPSISPYAYCNWNPMKYVDPDGKGVFPNAHLLREAGYQIMNNPKYQKNNGITHCNEGAQAINALAGDRSVLGTANAMSLFLRNEKNATSLTQKEALEYANKGVVVFANYYNENGGHGHVAIVAPSDKLSYSKVRNENVVSVFNIGNTNGEMSLGYAFGDKKVVLSILNSDLDKIVGTIVGGMLDEVTIIGTSPFLKREITQPANIPDCKIQLDL